jgi:RNA polymerase sigma-70 factor (ECF subfamily)
MTLTSGAAFALGTCTPEQFGAWVAPHLRAMSLLAARLSSDAERDDVVQEALVRAWTKRGQFDPLRGTASAWLLAITADRARRARRGRRPLLGVLPGRVRAIDDDLDLADAVARLSNRQRLAVECFYFVGLGVAETAAVMGCSEGTVKSTLSDARQRLRKVLEGE